MPLRAPVPLTYLLPSAPTRTPSPALASQVAREVNQQILQEMPFFVGADVNLTLDMALNMESTFYAAFEEVVIEGEEADAMYFIVAGSVEVLINVDGGKQLRVATLKQHQYFGELATPSEYPLSWHWYNMRVGQLVYPYIREGRQKVGAYISYTLGAAFG